MAVLSERGEPVERGGRQWWRRGTGVLAVYLVLTALCTRPLLELCRSHIAGNPGDPVLNASVLWWNATTVPFSQKWWSPPYFFPTKGVSAFTENLVGLSPIATPLYWITRSPIVSYNLTLFLTWPLSAFAVFLLMRFLTRRDDAAFVAGLAYGFSPYRTAEMGHIQMVASFWIPLALLGLHGYLAQRRVRWLTLFAVAWLLQSLANGYLMVYGAVLIALWLLYFCSARETRRAAPGILAAWVLASVPLVPIMLRYRAVHEFNGLRRDLSDVVSYSVPARGWLEVTDFVWLWRHVFPDAKDNLFPGATALILVVTAAIVCMRRQTGLERAPRRRRWLVHALAAGTAISIAVMLFTLFHGPFRAVVGGVALRISDIDRALTVALLCGIPFALLNERTRGALSRRSAFLFYAVATAAMGVLSCGPVIAVGRTIVFDRTPYYWLMYVPGVRELRVPSRFWMLGVLCLAVAAGHGFTRLRVSRRSTANALFLCATAGLLLDGWMREMPMTPAPERRARVERRDSSEPILELPLGPDWDAPATFRSMWHRRPVFNGVSGYDPIHYLPLEEGLNTHDPAMLLGLSSFGSFDVVIDESAGPGGEWTRYVAEFPGAVRMASDGTHTLYRVAAGSLAGPVGPTLPISQASSSRGDATAVSDGRVDTQWSDRPQLPGQWVAVDLGSVHDIGGITYAMGKYPHEFPRRLAIDISTDGAEWEQAWEGTTVAHAFRGAALAPMAATMQFTFSSHAGRFVRLRQTAFHPFTWRIAELQVHSPAR